MITKFEALGPTADVGDAAECLIRTTQHEFPVVDGAGKLRGVLTRDAMIEALNRDGARTPVVEVMLREVPAVPVHARLEEALRHLQEGKTPVVAVVDGFGRLVGYVTAENVGELMMIRKADPDARLRRRGPLLPQ
jgi:stage IV sporulation protein FB